jgi:uncharacterized membrane protein YfhO
MFEIFEPLILKLTSIFYDVHSNINFIEENMDLIIRCSDRASIIFDAHYTYRAILLQYFYEEWQNIHVVQFPEIKGISINITDLGFC